MIPLWIANRIERRVTDFGRLDGGVPLYWAADVASVEVAVVDAGDRAMAVVFDEEVGSTANGVDVVWPHSPAGEFADLMGRLR